MQISKLAAAILLCTPACAAQTRVFSLSATTTEQYSFTKVKPDTSIGATLEYHLDRYLRLTVGYSRNLTTTDNKVQAGLSFRFFNFGPKRKE